MKKELLTGKWKFNRHITDNMIKADRIANGQLVITETSWNEKGEMDGQPFFQQYKIDMQDNFTVLFNDDRVFYSLIDITAKQTIEHLCGNDLYQGIWELTEDKLNLQWIVKGKTKDYIMKTQYIKS